ncbi:MULTISPECIES: DUF86 domain-containing protein [unclassified Veillonella]|uniref:HepT-like ribonuclease domain-containing protein n=1 Tax=unclassified Veillonella TaxID=2630086 RepID=UPI0013E06780|nr:MULTISPECIES: HepT-like ribonuclease domain-containing protein [unclassified Veillonella]
MKNKDILVDTLDLMDRLDTSVRLYKIHDMEDFLFRDELEQDGLAYKIQAIAETLGKVSDDFKDRHTEIPWKNIKGMRNQLSHNYGQNNYRLIWVTYKEKLPELRNQLISILKEEYGYLHS